MLPGEPKRLLSSQNSHDAFFHLMTRYYNDLFRYGMRFTADAENTKDIVNQFFLDAWQKREKFLAAENIKAYLVVSFKRFLINHLRKSFPFKTVADYPEEPMEHSYEDYIIRFQENEAMKNALQESIQLLPVRQKELLMLRFYENMSYEEIAKKNSLSIRTVYNKIHLALKKLRSFQLLQQMRKNNISLSLLSIMVAYFPGFS
jgi:RNA polymerase sigma factor (sigma-70 family)